MRKLPLLLLALFTATAPMTAEAGPPVHPGNKPGKKPGKKPGTPPGKGKPSPPGVGGNVVVAKVHGAGQRLHFSFGGELTVRKNDRITGEFVVVAHPLAPVGTVLSVSCRFTRFSDPKLENNTIAFVGKGRCTRLHRSGEVVVHEATNEFRIADHPNTHDVFEAKLASPMGLNVPIGSVSFGELTIERDPS